MNSATVFMYEWKHFVRSPFKVVALLLFVVAGVYALQNGAKLYDRQVTEIEKINKQADEQHQEIIGYYNQGQKGPKNRPWIDVTTPFWALWNTPVYHFKSPSPAIVYSIGQAEQYGFYKRVTFQSSPYDADMAEEIANPERLQSGTLDFSFVVLYLLPLLLLIWLYNVKGAEADAGFLPLIFTQTGSEGSWLWARIAFYAVLLLLVVLGLMLFGAILTNVFGSAATAFWQIFVLVSSYLLLWTIAFGFILRSGNSSIGNTLKMVGLWLLFAFIIPASVHQWISTQHPANLMTDFIDAQRDKREELFNQPDSVFQAQLNALFPEILDSPVAKDSTKSNLAMNRSGAALTNELMKESFTTIETSNSAKNRLIRFSYWFNPVAFYQNSLNSLSRTHYQDYQNYRNEIQSLIDRQIRAMVLDTWEGVEVTKERYLEYNQTLAK